jgi:hypothetical protein
MSKVSFLSLATLLFIGHFSYASAVSKNENLTHHSVVSEIDFPKLSKRSDWLSDLPNLIDDIDICYGDVPPYYGAVFVFRAYRADNITNVRMASGWKPNQMQVFCQVSDSALGRRGRIELPDKGNFESVNGPYFAKYSKALTGNGTLILQRVIGDFNLERGVIGTQHRQ